MRKLITTTFITLDGVMQAPGGTEEDETGKFEHGGWSFPFWNETVASFMGDTMGKPFDLLLGRKTYDIFASFWPKQEGNVAKPLNEAHKYVASHNDHELPWQNSHLIKGDLISGVRELKQTDGPELQVHGSSNLLQTLLGGDVIDEMRVLIYPVVLGTGKKLFGDGTIPQSFKVTKTAVAENGVLMACYEPDGEVQVGSFSGSEEV